MDINFVWAFYFGVIFSLIEFLFLENILGTELQINKLQKLSVFFIAVANVIDGIVIVLITKIE
jgi:hypothetical protein